MDEPQRLDTQVLATKLLAPRAPRALIGRSRLDALLRLGLEKQLTLIAAPAGFGKTTLLATWLASLSEKQKANDQGQNESTESELLPFTFYLLPSPVRVAWVSLDAGDNNPHRFWLHVFTAIERGLPGAAQAALAMLGGGAPQITDALTSLINALATEEAPCILVLDDYHVIVEPQIHTALAFLLDHQPPQLRLFIATRAMPPLPLARLRASAAIQELREEQLRCTAEEAMAFLTDVMGIQLPNATLASIAARTEGWLVGLQLIGLWLQQRSDTDRILEELRGSHRYILDYVTEQVLDQQHAPMRRFLLCTSILEQFSADLCDAVLGIEPNVVIPEAGVVPLASDLHPAASSQEMLETLERANLFVVALDGQRRWYRYHALFAEALRYHLEQEDAALAPTLHVRASRWYAAQGRRYEAMQHALLSRDWEWARRSCPGCDELLILTAW
ncbi:MAG: AAA family ATPase [Blastochloris sp.]|nr:AAA family ATPase [Blastochloris sp.]